MGTEKQRFNSKKFTKEYKVREIQKSITKKTRLRKNYLKALKEEGYNIPEKREESRAKVNVKQLKEERAQQGKRKVDEKKELKRERQKIKRETAEERRNSQLERIKLSKQKHLERESRSQRLTQKTRSGQPLMGPKIEDLLDKIKHDDTYTR